VHFDPALWRLAAAPAVRSPRLAARLVTWDGVLRLPRGNGDRYWPPSAEWAGPVFGPALLVAWPMVAEDLGQLGMLARASTVSPASWTRRSTR